MDKLISQPIPPELHNAVWDDVSPLILEAIHNSEDEVTLRNVWESIQSGNCDLWVTTRGKEVVGATIVEPIITAKGIWLNIPFAGFIPDYEAMSSCLRRIEEVGELAGYRGVKYISADLRFGSFAKRKGYRRRYIEYVKEF